MKNLIGNRGYDLFNDLFLDSFLTKGGFDDMLRTDIKENEKNYIFEVEVPGIKKEDIKISLKNGYLNINATRTIQENENEEKIIRKERFSGTYTRSFYVGDDVKQKDVNASFENGILNITIPKESERDQSDTIISIQ